MTALAIDAPGSVVRTTLPIPGPAPGSVLVRPRHVGLCGTDLELLHGTAAYFADGRAGYPHVFGHEWWGEVVAVSGEGFAPGDPVVGHTMVSCGLCSACQRGKRQLCERMAEVGLYRQQGAAAEYVRMPAHALTRLPEELAEPHAVVVEPAVTVYESLARTGCGPDDRVAVVGTGTIGLLTVMLARHRGARVHAVGIDPSGLELAESFGATEVFASGDAPERAYSLVVEASGAPSAFTRALELAETGGRVAVVGVAGEPVGVVPGEFVLRGIDVFGIRHGLDHYENTVRLLADGVLDGEALIAETVPASDVGKAFELLESGRSGRPKVILDLSSLGAGV